MRMGLVWIVALAGGCSAIAGGGGDRPWECQIVDGDDFCAEVSAPGELLRCAVPEGETVGMCMPCSTEVCNGVDDDCDGVVDNALDEDGDGYYLCPTGPAPRDCDDQRADVHPTRGGASVALEVCDGIDNDCDPNTPDGSADCDPATEDCNPTEGCVPASCAARPELCMEDQFCDQMADPPTCRPRDTSCFNVDFACENGEVCDPTNGSCVLPMADGTPCDSDAECMSSLCVPIGVIRAPAAAVGDHVGVCGRSCCTDADCSTGARCWASGSGAKACVPETLLSAGSGAPEIAACAAARDCSDECRLTVDDAYLVASRVSLSCQPALTGRISCRTIFDCPLRLGPSTRCIDGSCQRAFCTSVDQCPTGLCAGNECREACGVAADCGGANGACVPINGRADGRDDYVTACSYFGPGTAPHGSDCNNDDVCLDRTCVDVSATTPPRLTCAAMCCSDTTCAGGEQCRPIFVHGRWENHCLPKPMFEPTASGG